MANSDDARGLIPRYMDNGQPLPDLVKLRSTTATAVFEGDLIKIGSNGRHIAITDDADNPTHIAREYVASTEASDTLFDAMPLNASLVCEIQVDDATLADATSNGAYFDVINESTGSTTSGMSQMELDGDASAEDTFELIGLVNRPDNAWGLNAKVYVKVRVNANAQVIATT